jgi:hypothetical protein
VQVDTPYIWLGPGWYPWLEFGPDHPHATMTAIRERVVNELGGRFEEYHPNDPEEGTEYAHIFIGKAMMMVASKGGIVPRIGADWRYIPILLRIADLYGAKRRGWRWPLYPLWYRLVGRRREAAPVLPRDRRGTMPPRRGW